jgi:exopolysaccharide biosynthesis polyprenyl glycosylphosphotransferase
MLLLLLGDILLLLACFIIPAQWTQDVPLDIYLLDEDGLWSVGLLVLVFVVGLYLSNLYENFREHSTSRLLQQLCLVLGVELLIQSMLSYLRSELVVSKWLILYGASAVVVVMPLWRGFFSRIVSRRLGAARLLFLGHSSLVEEIIHELNDRPELGFAVAGYMDTAPVAELEALGAKYLGPIEQVEVVVEKLRPGRIVVGLLDATARFPVGELLDLQFSGVPIERAGSTYERVFGRVPVNSLQATELIFAWPYRGSAIIQNLYSPVLALIGLFVSLPVMAVVAVLVKVTSPGPVLLRQTRVGKNRKHFTLFKFRSMYVDAEARTGAVWATKNDPRITPLGRVIRKLRLDELPQFFNVIRGDMSIVGPRPERPEFVEVLEEKIPFFRQRLCVKPGITGWAQINYKYGDTLKDTVTKLEFDLYYIKNLTPSLDAYIIFRTAKVMLLSEGAQ